MQLHDLFNFSYTGEYIGVIESNFLFRVKNGLNIVDKMGKSLYTFEGDIFSVKILPLLPKLRQPQYLLVNDENICILNSSLQQIPQLDTFSFVKPYFAKIK